MKLFNKICVLEGSLLVTAGIIHILFLAFAVDRGATSPSLYWGGMGFGIVYTVLGFFILARKLWALPPAVVFNALGLILVTLNFDQSPLKAVDPMLIAIDCISVPLLIYLNVWLHAYRREYE